MEKQNYQMTFKFNPILFKVLLKYLKPNSKEKILDIGCSRGFYIKKIENYTNGIVGIDVDRNSLEKAVTRKVRYGDINNLDFKDDTFDKIYSLHVIEHIPNLKNLFSETARVLKLGGLAIFVYPWEPFRGFQAIGTAIRLYKNPLMARKIHCHKLTPDRIKNFIKNTPFSHIESKFIFALGFHYLTVLTKK